MVQMKALNGLKDYCEKKSFISHMVQMKVNDKFIALHVKSLYIPHGSDERCIFCLFIHFLCILYIPHGSDESLSKLTYT